MLSIEDFRKQVRAAILNMNQPKYAELFSAFESELKQLRKDGSLAFAADYLLANKPLEWRIMELLQDLNLIVNPGRDYMEDLVVHPPGDLLPKKPLVVEVKSSSKSSSPSRDDLRQLDDWVFDLSGEESARKSGLQADPLEFELFGGMASPRSYHPSPHKGVFIFNGPLETPFENRPKVWLNSNEEAFAIKRDFCIISFHCLICWHEKSQQDMSISKVFWEEVHKTCGVLRNP